MVQYTHAVETQDSSHTYLAHHELGSNFIIALIVIVVMIIIVINNINIINLVNYQ